MLGSVRGICLLVSSALWLSVTACAAPPLSTATATPPAAAPATSLPQFTATPPGTPVRSATRPPSATLRPSAVVSPTLTKPAATALPALTFPPPLPTVAASCAPGATRIAWFIGLGTSGTQPEEVTLEKAWADRFNKSQKDACVVLQVVPDMGAGSYDAFRALLTGSSPPDIVGPVGKLQRGFFKGSWADLAPLARDAGFSLDRYNPKLLEFSRDEGVLVGIPFALYPSFIFYNKTLFDRAKLPYPPHKVGEKYNGKDWDLANLQDLAQKLTVDGAGNPATAAAFEARTIRQFGLYQQWTDARGLAAFFGGGLPYDTADPKRAVIPEPWKQAWKWYYAGIWKNNFMPSYDYYNGDASAQGNPFSTGRVAMTWTHLWYTCCFNLSKTQWDIAVVPSINDQTTAKLQGDTFVIPRASKNQKTAFKVLSKMVLDRDLLQIYGGMPAEPKEQAEFFAALSQRSAPNNIDWAVASQMLLYPDLPNHEAWVPNLGKANELFTAFRNKMDQVPGLDIDSEIGRLESDLDGAFKATGGR